MPIRILWNTIADPWRREATEKAVVAGIGDRHGDWITSVFEPQLSPEWIVEIKGPQNFIWSHTFFGPHEQNPDFIRRMVRQALKPGED
ncbi:MAG: hypothetical protein A3H28_06200 [Acidobacteria bacterium RIFCSPLOWO2_02_FULL_61_28]|nr:MAG: hypothetical protein A3H28_06200 [Acidobacteria bacterium RIFCSPLOWO2_02_FULL_61_28]